MGPDFYLISPVFRDRALDERAVTLEDLKVLSTIEEITGFLKFAPYSYQPSITNLDVFRNLRKVGGAAV